MEFYGIDANLVNLFTLLFFATYVLISIPSSMFLERYGLRNGVLCGWLGMMLMSGRLDAHWILAFIFGFAVPIRV